MNFIERTSYIAFSGYWNSIFMKDNTKKISESVDSRFEKILEEEKKMAAPVYNCKGEVIEYYEDGRHLNLSG